MTEVASVVNLGDVLDFPTTNIFGRVIGLSAVRVNSPTGTHQVFRYTKVELFDFSKCKNVVVAVKDTKVARGAWFLSVNLVY